MNVSHETLNIIPQNNIIFLNSKVNTRIRTIFADRKYPHISNIIYLLKL